MPKLKQLEKRRPSLMRLLTIDVLSHALDGTSGVMKAVSESKNTCLAMQMNSHCIWLGFCSRLMREPNWLPLPHRQQHNAANITIACRY